MKIIISFYLLILLSFFSCDSRKSINKESQPVKDITREEIIMPEGLSCDEAWLSVNQERIDRRTFIYGEVFYVHFNNIEGFNKADGAVFPGLSLKVIAETGDTIIKTEDIYADSANGIKISPLSLTTKFTVQKPVRSNHNYTLMIKIWDKLGDGTLINKVPYSVIPDERISIENNAVSYDEIYLFSADRDKAIIDGVIDFGETIYLVFEGLSGFYEETGKIFPGAAVRAYDNENISLMYFEDLFQSFTKTGINSGDFKERIYVKMAFDEGKVYNPIHCETIIFDKRRKAAYIKVGTELNVNINSTDEYLN